MSMTGFGDSRWEQEGISTHIEVRTVNNRFLKVSIRCSNEYAPLESEFERIIREYVTRGTVQVEIQVARQSQSENYRLNPQVIEGYVFQLRETAEKLGIPGPIDLGQILTLPGVALETNPDTKQLEQEFPLIEKSLREAMQKLQNYRKEEGGAMGRTLESLVQTIRQQLDRIEQDAPVVVEEYRKKLLERVRQVVSEEGVAIEPKDIIREVSIYADRVDIHEEISRLRCHLEQFLSFLHEVASTGRKLDFLCQEINREVNTIGSKANHVPIARCVVEMKSAVEQVRELLQNVE